MRETFYCIFHGRGGEWEGFCLDLDIAIQARSFDEAKNLMGDAIDTYIQDAMKEAEPARTALLNRSVPFRVRAYWAMRVAMAAFRGRKRDDDISVGYPVPCHV
jgi:hypothetical protein